MTKLERLQAGKSKTSGASPTAGRVKRKRKKFVRRVIRSDGTVRVYGRVFSCSRDASSFAGESPLFGCYFDSAYEVVGLSLWGHPDDDWPGRYCHSDGHFYWQFWFIHRAEG